MRLRVLELGASVNPQAQFVYEDADIINVDINIDENPTVVADAARLPFATGSVDGVFASHILEHFSYYFTLHILNEWARVLTDGGMLHVLVPSLEWCARQILAEQPSKALLAMLYGGQDTPWNVHWAGFTMRKLRADFEKIGLSVVAARVGQRSVVVDGQIILGEQHYVCGVKGRPPLTKD